MKKAKSLLLVFLLLPALLAGCKQEEQPFRVLFAAPFVNEQLAGSFGETLGVEGLYEGFSFNAPDVDAMAYGASTMLLTAKVSAGEADVIVCDLAEAARYARSGIFYDLTEIFTPEELAAWEADLVSFEILDAYGESTGETTGPCGVNISGTTSVTYVMGGDSYGVFIAAGADLERAKEVFRALIDL